MKLSAFFCHVLFCFVLFSFFILVAKIAIIFFHALFLLFFGAEMFWSLRGLDTAIDNKSAHHLLSRRVTKFHHYFRCDENFAQN